MRPVPAEFPFSAELETPRKAKEAPLKPEEGAPMSIAQPNLTINKNQSGKAKPLGNSKGKKPSPINRKSRDRRFHFILRKIVRKDETGKTDPRDTEDKARCLEKSTASRNRNTRSRSNRNQSVSSSRRSERERTKEGKWRKRKSATNVLRQVSKKFSDWAFLKIEKEMTSTLTAAAGEAGPQGPIWNNRVRFWRRSRTPKSCWITWSSTTGLYLPRQQPMSNVDQPFWRTREGLVCGLKLQGFYTIYTHMSGRSRACVNIKTTAMLFFVLTSAPRTEQGLLASAYMPHDEAALTEPFIKLQ